jgi:hypothetical protein
MAGTDKTSSGVSSGGNDVISIQRGGQLETDLTAIWLLVAAFLVFFMQVSFNSS